MKKVILLLTLIFIFTFSGIALADQSIKLIVNGQTIKQEVTPQIINDRTYFSVSVLGNALGVTNDNILWDGSKNTVILIKGDKVVQMTIGNDALLVNGKVTIMDVLPLMINDRIMLPAAYVAGALGYNVAWDNSNNAVIVSNVTPLNTSTTDSNVTPLNTSTTDSNVTPLNTSTTDSIEKQEFLKIDAQVTQLLNDIDSLLKKDLISATDFSELNDNLNKEVDIIRAWPELSQYSTIKDMFIQTLINGNKACEAKEFITDPKYIKSVNESRRLLLQYSQDYNNGKIDIRTEKIKLQK